MLPFGKAQGDETSDRVLSTAHPYFLDVNLLGQS